MKNVKIVFERDAGIVASLIRKFTRYDSNHVAIQYDSDDWGTPWVLEATTTRGVHPFPIRNRKWTHVYQVNCDLVPAIRACESLIGENYDFASILIFGWIFILWDYLKLKLFRPHWSLRGKNCSEYLACVLNRKFTNAFDAPQWTSPAVIAAFMDQHPDSFTKQEEKTE